MTMRHPETDAIRLQTKSGAQQERSVPIYATSSFLFDSAEHAAALFAEEQQGNIYSRYANPNCDEFITKLVRLENAEDGLATASGMAAVWVSLATFLNSGDHLVAARSLFGSTHQILTQILPRWGIRHTLVDIDRPEQFEQAIEPQTRMILIETPSNPALDLIDIGQLAEVAGRHDLLLNVDNTFATPSLQQPLELGANIVTHSATKFLDGQGRVLGGAVLASRTLVDKMRFFYRHTGPSLSPFHAWLISKSMETLAIRVERHCTSALSVAEWLEEQPAVTNVRYPFLPSHPQYELAQRQMSKGGALIAFELRGGIDAGRDFINALQLISHTANLGDARSIVTHPASTTHSKLSEEEQRAVGITPGLVRISVGLEHAADIQDDLEQALQSSSNPTRSPSSGTEAR